MRAGRTGRVPVRFAGALFFGLVAVGIPVWAYVSLSQPISDSEWEGLGRILSFLIFFVPFFLASAIISLVLAQPQHRWLRRLRLFLLSGFGLFAGSCSVSLAPVVGAGVEGLLLFALIGLPLLLLSIGALVTAGRDLRDSRAADA